MAKNVSRQSDRFGYRGSLAVKLPTHFTHRTFNYIYCKKIEKEKKVQWESIHNSNLEHLIIFISKKGKKFNTKASITTRN